MEELTIDELFLSVDESLKEQFMACFNHFLDTKKITAEQFKTYQPMYLHDFKSLWSAHCLLLESDDECYGKLVTKQS